MGETLLVTAFLCVCGKNSSVITIEFWQISYRNSIKDTLDCSCFPSHFTSYRFDFPYRARRWNYASVHEMHRSIKTPVCRRLSNFDIESRVKLNIIIIFEYIKHHTLCKVNCISMMSETTNHSMESACVDGSSSRSPYESREKKRNKNSRPYN